MGPTEGVEGRKVNKDARDAMRSEDKEPDDLTYPQSLRTGEMARV